MLRQVLIKLCPGSSASREIFERGRAANVEMPMEREDGKLDDEQTAMLRGYESN
jgi:hypothetical protein